MEDIYKELDKDLFETKLEYKGYKLLFLSQIFITNYYFSGYGKSFNSMNVIKMFSLDSVVKFFLFKKENFFKKKRPNLQLDYFFINEVNNKSMIELNNLLKKKFVDGNIAVLIADIRMGKPDEKTINIFELLSLKTILVSIFHCVAIIPSICRSKEEIKFISRKYKVNRTLLVLNFFDSILLINLVKNVFERVKANKYVSTSDFHKLSRIIVMHAKEMKIPTFVTQHGAPVGEHGLPILADKMLVWGEGSKKWYTDRAQSADKIEIVGSLFMDSVRYKAPKLLDSNRKELKKILIVMSVVVHEELFLKTIKDAFVKMSHRPAEIIIKLHPGGSVDYSFIPEKVFAQSGLSYKICRFENMKELLSDADIVFVTSSTVGMEAIICNKPIFQYKSATGFNYRMSYEDFDCSHIFTTAENIIETMADTQKVFSKLMNYERFVNYFFYKLDGNSAQRAKEYIIQYPLEQ